MLKRSLQSYQGGLWTAAPGGKVEKGETTLQAAIREVFEETGIRLDSQNLLSKGQLFFQFPDTEYVLHIYYTQLSSLPKVVIDAEEHTEFRWATLEEARQMPLMRGGRECLKQVFEKTQE